MRKLVLFILSLCLWNLLHAQSPQLYSTGQGLISTRINQITYDKDNFLWITTNQGLCRFDGQSFYTYQKQEGNPYSLQENKVTSLYEDNSGKHWIGAADGLYYLCRTENKLQHYVIDSTLTDISVSDIVPYPNDSNLIIIGTYGYGVRVFNKETKAIDRRLTVTFCYMLKRFNIQHMKADAHHHLWIVNPDGLQCIDMDKEELVPLPENIVNIKPLVIQDIIEDHRHDRLYFATVNRGLLCCDLSSMEFSIVDMPELNNSNLTALALSPEGDLIVGTESEGLWRVHLGQAKRIQVEDCPVDLDHIKVHSITYDDQRNLWLGLYQKGLLVIPNQKRLFTCRPIRPIGSIHNLGSISSFASMSDGSRLYGIDGEGVLLENTDGTTTLFNTSNSELETNSVLSVVALPNRHAFIGTYNYGVYFYDGKTIRRDPMLKLLDKQSIMTMANDTLTRTLYIGTNGDGIYAYRPGSRLLRRLSGERHLLWIVSLTMDRRHRLWASTEGSIICFDIDREDRINPPYSVPVRAYGCEEDNNGTLWFATDHGLLTYGAGSDSLQLVHSEGETLSEEFFSILQSKDGRFWLPSSNGLVCYDPHRKSVSRYFDPEIAKVGSFSSRAATMWRNGSLSFGGDNGVVDFAPEAVIAYHRSLRPIQFTQLWVNNLQTDYDPNLSPEENILDESLWKATRMHLPYSSNSFTLSFSVQEYGNPLGIRYFYQLKGFDKGWHEIFGQDKTAIYSSLPWGEFTLEVKAVLREANGEIQTVTKELKVEIDAPMWASWWAILLYTLAFCIAFAAIAQSLRIRAHQRKIVRRAEHNRQIKEAKLRMFTSVSHEIMTPLTLIISPLRRLMQRNNDNATQSVYEMMYRSCLRILMLVTQQMDIRKIDNGQLRLHVAEIPLRGFLDDIMQYFSNTAMQRQIDFQLLIPDDKREVTLWFDPEQLDKVFFNLLSNAFKFVNDDGQVHIKVSISDSKEVLNIEVYNSGSHIDESMEHLFERFGTEGGDSLGLSLANDLTEMHHGTLTARNEQNGVSFCVTLPMGDKHFTDEEKEPVRRIRRTEEESLALEARAIREEGNDSNEGKELIEMLSDELHEKQRLRERRSSLSFNFKDKELSSADERLLNRVADCISKNLGDPDFTVDELADQIGISRVHLNRKLKELIDTSPSSLIKNTRLKQAAFLLVQNNVTIAEVAYSVGFSSPAYFSSNFSAYFNMTPKEFVNTYTEDPSNPELLKLLE